jgi:anti-sigma factor RsiW
MAEEQDKTADGRALWDRARGSTLDALAAQAPDLDAGDLAAYLDGGLDETACARVEAALASRPDSLELLIAAREALGAIPEAPAVPEALVARAQALAPARKLAASNWTGRLAGWLGAVSGSSFALGRGVAFAGVAAGFLAISVAGFELGRAEVQYSTQVDTLLDQDVAVLVGQDGEDLL